jgi:hypothetical protein
LKEFVCWGNNITKIENLPDSLEKFHCWENNIKKIENLPESLQDFCYTGSQVQFVDNVTIERYKKFFSEFEIEDYTKIKKCQRVVIKWYYRRKRKAKLVSNAVHNWVWKPLCRDGSYGVRLRLDTKELGLNPE